MTPSPVCNDSLCGSVAKGDQIGDGVKLPASILAAFMLVFLPAALWAKDPPHELTGEEWMKMVQDEKVAFVKSVIEFYEGQGVAVSKPAGFYVYTLNTTILSNASQESEKAADILNSALYENEPALRAAADRSGLSPTKIEMH